MLPLLSFRVLSAHSLLSPPEIGALVAWGKVVPMIESSIEFLVMMSLDSPEWKTPFD